MNKNYWQHRVKMMRSLVQNRTIFIQTRWQQLYSVLNKGYIYCFPVFSNGIEKTVSKRKVSACSSEINPLQSVVWTCNESGCNPSTCNGSVSLKAGFCIKLICMRFSNTHGWSSAIFKVWPKILYVRLSYFVEQGKNCTPPRVHSKNTL